MIWKVLFAIAWIGCGVISSTALWSYCQRGFALVTESMISQHRCLMFCYFVMGPLGLIAVYPMTDCFKYGFGFRPLSDDEREALIAQQHDAGMVEYWRKNRSRI